MATNWTIVPNERDLEAVEGRLAALYADLPAAQQALLENIVLAGIDTLAAGDTSGYFDLETHFAAQRAELHRAWRRADQRGPGDRERELAAAAEPEQRRVLQPLLDLLRRMPAAQSPSSGGAPA